MYWIIASFSACGIEINVVMRCSPSPFGCYVETLIAFALIHQNDGSSDGSPPTGDEQQPSASYLRQRFLQSNNNISVMSPSPLFGLPTDSNTLTLEPSLTCIDTPNWKDLYGNGCDWYEELDGRCSGTMTAAKSNCCYCIGASHDALSPTVAHSRLPSTSFSYSPINSISGVPSDPPSNSASPSSSSSPSSAPTLCEDTPGWYDFNGYDCSWYELMDDPGCQKYGYKFANYTDMYGDHKGVGNDNCCLWKNTLAYIVVSEYHM